MPMPTTAKWPKPKDEDEFEDIAVDFLRLRWKDPHAARNGRRGQVQNGIDIIGRPPWLKGQMAGAQCKNTDAVSLKKVIDAVNEAGMFKGDLGEFLFVTTADRDSALQANVKSYFKHAVVPVEVVFWQDITSELASSEELVAKHWKGFPGSSARPDGFLPPQRRIDRSAVNSDERTESHCEATLYVPMGLALDASELAAELERLAQEQCGGLIIPWLLRQPLTRLEHLIKWAGFHRECLNVIRKFELEVGDRGVLTYRTAKFTDKYCMFETSALHDAILVAAQVFRPAIERAVQHLGIPTPSKLAMRLSAHGTETLELHDNYRMTTTVFSALSMADWIATLEAEQRIFFSQPNILRLLNRALSNFHHEGARSSLIRINENSPAILKLLAACCDSPRGLDAFGAEYLDS